ncbi:MAG: hypothetical protein WC781_04175 [Candidatus Pacearchaeota archaeon]|jgi:hypothetical protein
MKSKELRKLEKQRNEIKGKIDNLFQAELPIDTLYNEFDKLHAQEVSLMDKICRIDIGRCFYCPLTLNTYKI